MQNSQQINQYPPRQQSHSSQTPNLNRNSVNGVGGNVTNGSVRMQGNNAAGGNAVRRPTGQRGAPQRQTPSATPAQNNTNTAARPKRTGDFVKPTDLVRVKGNVDKPLLVVIILLVCFGAIMVFSSSYAFSLRKYGDSYHYIRREMAYIGVGMCAMFAASHLDYRLLRKYNAIIFFAAAALLVAVPFVGYGKGLARRWIYIGSISIQPSEIMKFAIVVFLAWYMAKYQYKITDYDNLMRASKFGVFYPMAVVAGVCACIAVENHLSGVIIMFLLGTLIVYVGGGVKRWFFIAIGIGIIGVLIILIVAPYTMTRVQMWLHPENYSEDDELYQTLQSLDAIGSGGIFGKGLGNSTQKHLYIAEPMNDFIFAIVCEELGLVGATALILLFALLIWRGIHIARRAPDTFSSLVAFGLTAKVGIQAVMNMFVVTNLMPNTGISLPFISYGGTAFLMQLGEMGILLSISRYSYVKTGQGQKAAQPTQ